MTGIHRDVAERLREHSNRLLAEAIREGASSEAAQQKLRLREQIESHLMAMDALAETGAAGESVTRVLAKLEERLEIRQPA